jgi:hypothetical protein
MATIDISQYDLDLSNYTIHDIFRLFQIKPNEKITKEKMLNIKKHILKYHPDKSNKPIEIYMFYKSAFDQLKSFYYLQMQNNQLSNIKNYNDVLENHFEKKNINTEQIQGKPFLNDFNQFFENNVIQPKNTNRNDWFHTNKVIDENPITQTSYNPNDLSSFFEENKIFVSGGSKETNDAIAEKIKDIKRQQGALIEYKGFQEIVATGGSNYLENNEEDDNEYATSNMFSALPFDDIRKVYRDQPIFCGVDEDKKINVETDIEKYKKQRMVKVNDAIYKKKELLEEREKRKKMALFKEKQLRDFEEDKRKKELSEQFLSKYLQIKSS